MSEVVFTIFGALVGLVLGLVGERANRLRGFRHKVSVQMAELNFAEKDGSAAVAAFYTATLKEMAGIMSSIREDIFPWQVSDFDTACRNYLEAGDEYGQDRRRQVIAVAFPSADAAGPIAPVRPLAERMAVSLKGAARAARVLSVI